MIVSIRFFGLLMTLKHLVKLAQLRNQKFKGQNMKRLIPVRTYFKTAIYAVIAIALLLATDAALIANGV
jgi:hypothetical protein